MSLFNLGELEAIGGAFLRGWQDAMAMRRCRNPYEYPEGVAERLSLAFLAQGLAGPEDSSMFGIRLRLRDAYDLGYRKGLGGGYVGGDVRQSS